MTEQEILHENGNHWICRAKSFKGFEVYKNEVTHSVLVARIGFEGNEGMKRAIVECERREKFK